MIKGSVVIEGYLKKLKKYLMSSKNYYKVVGKVMLIASNPRKPFTEKYDLTNYMAQLSQGDNKKFYLYPLNHHLQLNPIRFVAESADERARWYKAIQSVTQKPTPAQSQ